MTFRELQDDTLERTTFDSGPASSSSSARKRIKRFLNEAYRRLLRTTGLGRTMTGTTTIVTVDGTAQYEVTASEIRSIYSTATGSTLDPITLAELRLIDPHGTGTGFPTHYAVEKVGATTVTVTLYPTPEGAGTLNVDVAVNTTPLSDDGDVPVLPEDFHYLLGAGARMLEAEKMQQTENYKIAQAEMVRGTGELRLWVARGRRKIVSTRHKGAFLAKTGSSWIDWGL